jgi:hypothetical protein
MSIEKAIGKQQIIRIFKSYTLIASRTIKSLEVDIHGILEIERIGNPSTVFTFLYLKPEKDIFRVDDIFSRRIFRSELVVMSMDSLLESGIKKLFIDIYRCFFLHVFFFRVLYVIYAVTLVSEERTTGAVLTSGEIITSKTSITVYASNTVGRRIGIHTIDELITVLTVATVITVHDIFIVHHPSAVQSIFVLARCKDEVTILHIGGIVYVRAIFRVRDEKSHLWYVP